MSQPDNPSLRQQVIDYLNAHRDEALTWVETHGLLCALACGPAPEGDWTGLVHEAGVPDDIASALEQLRQRLHARLGLGESLQLPCRLDPWEDNEGRDLASWCAGFMAGVTAMEEHWHEAGDEALVEKLLPFLLISGLDEDPELDLLWQDTRLVRQMALGIPDLIEELFLLFHAPAAEPGAPTDEE